MSFAGPQCKVMDRDFFTVNLFKAQIFVVSKSVASVEVVLLRLWVERAEIISRCVWCASWGYIHVVKNTIFLIGNDQMEF